MVSVRDSPAITCLQQTHPSSSHSLNLQGYMAHHYDHVDKDRANEGIHKFSGLTQITVILISLKMLFPSVQYLKLLQKYADFNKRR